MVSPLKALLVGIGGTALFGVLTVYLFFFASRPLSPSEIETIAGQVARVETLRPARGSDSLQIWLIGETLPFRGNAGYPKYYRKHALNRLIASASVEIGFRPSQRRSPARDRLQRQDFIPITTLAVEGVPALTLDDSNHWTAENQRIGRYVAPALLACSLLLLGHGLRQRRRSALDPMQSDDLAIP